jgi:membrane protein DedA with SNARE-associated domain
MTVQDFVQTIVTFVREHESWAVPIAFLVAFAESFCFLSILWPGTAILVGVSGLLAASGADIRILWPAIIAAAAGGSVGYAVSYWIGLYFKDSIPNIWPFRSQPELISRGQAFFEKYGAWSVFFGHFFGPVRAVIPVVAGMFQMRQLPFQIANIISAFIWAAGVIAPSFFAVLFKDEILSFVREHQLVAVAALFLTAFLNSIPMLVMAIPTLVLFIAIGGVLLFAGGDPTLAVLAGVAGAFAGDLFAYMSGRQHETDLHDIWPNSWSAEAAGKADAFVKKLGVASLVPSKFHTSLRSFAPLVAGARRLAFGGFAVVSLISAVIWSLVLLSPRYLLSLLGY